MLWVKALHVIFVVSWFAGLFYLPRIYVNLAQADGAGYELLLAMAGRLWRFMQPLAVLALGFGLWMWLGYGVGRGPGNGWLHAKLALVVLLIGYHAWCGVLLRQFRARTNEHGHRWYRVFNEAAVLLLAAIVILVIVKPF